MYGLINNLSVTNEFNIELIIFILINKKEIHNQQYLSIHQLIFQLIN